MMYRCHVTGHSIVIYSRCAQVYVLNLNGKQSWSVGPSNDTSILALDLLLDGSNWVPIVGMLGGAHIVFVTIFLDVGLSKDRKHRTQTT